MPLKLHNYNDTNFETGCVHYLDEAYEVSVENAINEEGTLNFKFPLTSEKAESIEENMIVSVEGKGYRLAKIELSKEMGTMTCIGKSLHTFDLMQKHIQKIPVSAEAYIAESPKTVIDACLEGTAFSTFTEDELNTLGMTWVGSDGFKIDFFEMSKTTPWNVITAVIENCGKGEIYADNFKIALVERMGEDNGVRLSLSENLKTLKITRDVGSIVTRLYPYGKDDLHIGSVNDGVQYIDSENIGTYGVREGYRDYSDYTNPQKVLDNARWEFSEKNESRIDVPSMAISGTLIDLSKLVEYGDIKKVRLGDKVRVIDGGIEYVQRVVRIKEYPYEPKQTEITIGRKEKNLFFYLDQMLKGSKDYMNNTATNGSYQTGSLFGSVSSNHNPIKSDNDLLKIKGDLLTIYNKNGKNRLQLGNVDEQFALNIYDDDGEQLKIKLGDYGDKYAFAIYDSKGNPAIYMDENGDVIFSGKLETYKKASIGQELIIGAVDESISTIRFQGEINQSIIENDDIKKIFKISPSFGGDLVIDENGIYFDGSKLSTERSISSLENRIKNWVLENFQPKTE